MGRGDATALPGGYTVRRGARSDLQAVHELITAVDVAVLGEPDTTLDDLAAEWDRPRVDVSRDVDVVTAPAGRLVGYAAVFEESPGLELQADVYAAPDLVGEVPVERHLTERVVVRAQRYADTAQSRISVVCYAVAHEPLGAELQACGFEVRRRFWRMGIDLDDVEVGPPPPDVTIAPLDVERDLPEVHGVLTEAFSEHWGSHATGFEEWRTRNLDRADTDPSLWQVARQGGQVVGAIIGREHRDRAAGWVPTVGVRADARGRGIAESLLRSAFAAFADRGLTRAGLGVDSQNATGATRVYERAGMHVELEIWAWVLDVEPSGERTA